MKLVGKDGLIAQFLMDGENRGLAENTLMIYERCLQLMARWLEGEGVYDVERVTVGHLRQFIHFLKHPDKENMRFPGARRQPGEEVSVHTITLYVGVVKAFFTWCVDEELITANPSSRLKRPKMPERVVATFTPEHIEKMLATCDTSTSRGFRDYVLLLVLLDTGMRVSELCDLRVQNVYTNFVKVHGKGNREREIGLHPAVRKLLWRYIQRYRCPSDPEEDRVFLGRRGALTVGGVEQLFQRVKRNAGIGDDVRVSPHTMRHTFSKWYMKRGGDLFKLSRELGHSSVQVTGKIYLSDFKSEDARQDHNSYSPIGVLRLGNTGKRGRKKR